MKHIDYIYFNIYSYFYRISLERQSVNARVQAMFLFSLGSGGWILLMETLYLHLIRHSWFPSPAESMIFASSIYMLIALFFNYIFIVKDRDQKIFGKYEELFTENPKRQRHFIISLSVLIMPYLVLMVSGIIFRRHGA
jgi:hypothetical protein